MAALEKVDWSITYEQSFQIAEEVLRDYQTFLAMKLPASKEQSDSFEADDLCFQLLLIAMKLRLERMTIEEVDFKYLKKSIQRRPNIMNGVLFSDISELLSKSFMRAQHFMMARVFFMLHKHSQNLTQTLNSKFKELLNLVNSLGHLESMLYRSVDMMKKECTWTDEQRAREDSFKDLLKAVNVKVILTIL